MYVCEICETQTAPNVPCHLIQTETRKKVYPARHGANDPGGSGHETVKEVRACPSCASEVLGSSDASVSEDLAP